MKSERHVHHYHRHFGFSYPTSFLQAFYSILVGPLVITVLLLVIAKTFSFTLPVTTDSITLSVLLSALFHTVIRLLIAYILAVVVAIPLALIAVSNHFFESILLPVFDILESIPILAFFPVLILVFIRFNFLNGAAVFILFLAMVWNLVFTLVGGLKIIPRDIIHAAKIFGLTGWDYFKTLTLPAIVPELVTGSILALAQGWNLIIVAEVLHVYLPGGSASNDLFGIGSLLVSSAANSQTTVFIWSIAIMVVAIALLNFFVWQKLLHYAERFKFE